MVEQEMALIQGTVKYRMGASTDKLRNRPERHQDPLLSYESPHRAR